MSEPKVIHIVTEAKDVFPPDHVYEDSSAMFKGVPVAYIEKAAYDQVKAERDSHREKLKIAEGALKLIEAEAAISTPSWSAAEAKLALTAIRNKEPHEKE